jgi:hypothetical protein
VVLARGDQQQRLRQRRALYTGCPLRSGRNHGGRHRKTARACSAMSSASAASLSR